MTLEQDLSSLQLSSYFNIASCSLGAAQASVEVAKDHLTVRKQFGQPLIDFQVSQYFISRRSVRSRVKTFFKMFIFSTTSLCWRKWLPI